jgi:hypothetical protein
MILLPPKPLLLDVKRSDHRRKKLTPLQKLQTNSHLPRTRRDLLPQPAEVTAMKQKAQEIWMMKAVTHSRVVFLDPEVIPWACQAHYEP